MEHERLNRSFAKYLEKQNLRVTSQRQAILDTFLCTSEHVSAEDLSHMVRLQHPTIGQATVFRTLKLIAEAGIAQEIQLDDRTMRYENTLDGHHDHFRCVACGSIHEIFSAELEALQARLVEEQGFILKSHRLHMEGLCKTCAQQQKP